MALVDSMGNVVRADNIPEGNPTGNVPYTGVPGAYRGVTIEKIPEHGWAVQTEKASIILNSLTMYNHGTEDVFIRLSSTEPGGSDMIFKAAPKFDNEPMIPKDRGIGFQGSIQVRAYSLPGTDPIEANVTVVLVID